MSSPRALPLSHAGAGGRHSGTRHLARRSRRVLRVGGAPARPGARRAPGHRRRPRRRPWCRLLGLVRGAWPRRAVGDAHGAGARALPATRSCGHPTSRHIARRPIDVFATPACRRAGRRAGLDRRGLPRLQRDRAGSGAARIRTSPPATSTPRPGSTPRRGSAGPFSPRRACRVSIGIGSSQSRREDRGQSRQARWRARGRARTRGDVPRGAPGRGAPRRGPEDTRAARGAAHPRDRRPGARAGRGARGDARRRGRRARAPRAGNRRRARRRRPAHAPLDLARDDVRDTTRPTRA